MAHSIEKAKIYGVDGIGAEDPALKRTDDAVGLTCSVGESEIDSDFDLCYPWSDMHEVTDKEGNVFVKIPRFYSKFTENADGTKRLQISGVRYDGFATLFIDGKGNEIDHVLVGKYEASGSAEKMFSKSGASALVDIDLDEARTAAKANGEGYQQYDFLIHNIIQQLFTVEFATTNSQEIMQGYVSADNVAAIGTGRTDGVKTPSGSEVSNSDGQHACKYRGIENPWGNLFKWCDGISFDGTKIFVCFDPEQYEGAKTIAPYRYVGDCLVEQAGYLGGIEQLESLPLLTYGAKLGGNGSTYFCDRIWVGSNALEVGAYWNRGNFAGIWSCSSDHPNTFKNSATTARLCCKPL